MKIILTFCMFFSLLLMLVACGSPVGEQAPEELVEFEPQTTASPTIQPSLPPTEEATEPTRLATATSTETATPTATAMPTKTPTEMVMVEPTQSATATEIIVSPTPSKIPRDNRTGIPRLDFVIETILSNDLEARQALVQFVTLGCTTADGLGTTPKCENGQADGTLVDFFPLGGPGEGHSVPPSEVARVLDFEAESLYAAYVVSEDLPDHVDYPHGTFALLFIIVPSEDSYNDSAIFRVDDEGYIVRLDFLGGMPLDFYFEQKVADLLETPPETEMFASEAAEILVYPPETDQ